MKRTLSLCEYIWAISVPFTCSPISVWISSIRSCSKHSLGLCLYLSASTSASVSLSAPSVSRSLQALLFAISAIFVVFVILAISAIFCRLSSRPAVGNTLKFDLSPCHPVVFSKPAFRFRYPSHIHTLALADPSPPPLSLTLFFIESTS